jgi:hypothetical protein
MSFVESAVSGIAGGLFGKSAGAASVEVDGRHVPLNREGIERAQHDGAQVGKGLAEAVRSAVDSAGDGG